MANPEYGSGHGDKGGLLGRQLECAALDGVVDAVRTGESRALVLHGPPGVGKSALLGHLSDSATDLLVLRAVGIEPEMELTFATLHQLCVPLLDRLWNLPAPQCAALETVFGIRAGPPPDRFLIAMAVLSLLSDASEKRPLLCLVDDAQWMDRASAQVLGFVARRLPHGVHRPGLRHPRAGTRPARAAGTRGHRPAGRRRTHPARLGHARPARPGHLRPASSRRAEAIPTPCWNCPAG